MVYLKRFFYFCLIMAGISLLVFFLVRSRSVIPMNLFGQENAIWSESVFFRGYHQVDMQPLTEEYIRDFADRLKREHITYAYIFGGPFQKDGHLPGYVFSDTARASIKKLKQYYPELKVLPWVGGLENKTVFLYDSAWRSHAISDCKKLIAFLDIPGIHMDLEYIVPGLTSMDTIVKPRGSADMDAYPGYVNAFHKQLRDSLPDAFISSVVTSTCPQSTHWKRKTSVTELRGLIPFVDQLSFLFYDTNIQDTATYRQAALLQMRDIQLLKAQRNIQMLVSIATFTNPVEFERFHNREVESVSNTLSTIKRAAFFVSPSKKLIDGISIFCNWQTSPENWNAIHENYTKYANN